MIAAGDGMLWSAEGSLEPSLTKRLYKAAPKLVLSGHH